MINSLPNKNEDKSTTVITTDDKKDEIKKNTTKNATSTIKDTTSSTDAIPVNDATTVETPIVLEKGDAGLVIGLVFIFVFIFIVGGALGYMVYLKHKDKEEGKR